MLRRHAPVLAPLALFLVLSVCQWRASEEAFRGMGVDRFEIRYIPSGRALRLLSPSAQLSVADYYWLLTVQYIGAGQRIEFGGYDRLFPLVDLVTDLDPRHGYAYQTAGIGLSAALRLDESDAILRKGIEKGPNWWSYPFYIAFNHFFYRGDYATAARWAEQAARTPGASTNISQLALALKVKSGSPDDAVRFLEEVRALPHDERTQAAIEEQYRTAVLQRNFAILDAAVQRFHEARGRPPTTLREVVQSGVLREIPRDPYGGSYELRDGKVHSTARDFRFSAPEAGRLEQLRKLGAKVPP